jgi:hypothetical protein
MLNSAKLTQDLRHGLWAECANTATLLENITVRNDESKTPYELFHGKQSEKFEFLRKFGEVAVVTNKDNIQGKLENRGITTLFVGYTENHSNDVYRMLNLTTNRILTTRDIIWTGKNYAEFKHHHDGEIIETLIVPDKPLSAESETGRELTPGRDERDENEFNNPAHDQDEEPQQKERQTVPNVPAPTLTREKNTKVINAMKKISGTWFNPEADKIKDDAIAQERLLDEQLDQRNEEIGNNAMDTVIEQLFGEVAFFVREYVLQDTSEMMENLPTKHISINPNEHILDQLDRAVKEENEELLKTIVKHLNENLPTTYQEAYNYKDARIKERWRKAIKKELDSMIKLKVWTKIKKKEVPIGRICVKTKWVFMVKRNGIFRARLVACGYSQIPGVDFIESYAPVINDITWRILLIAKLVWKMKAVIVDVETAFLYGELEEEIYMDCPEGIESTSEECVKLEHAIYGLVQAARQYYKKFISVLRFAGFNGGYADPCLMMRQNEHGLVYIAIWVDDSLVIGNKEAINALINDLEGSGFTLKIQGTLDDYLSCEITISKDEKKAWIHQPHLLKKLEEKFSDKVNQLQHYNTPGTPGLINLRNVGVTVDSEKHKIYRSGVGMLLYLTKHTRPDIANPVRELSKTLDQPSPAAYKEMLRVLKYVMDTKNLALKIQPEMGEENVWTLIAFCDSDFASDRETRISITGFILYLLGVPISWKSKAQKGVTLSSSEAEYVALSEAAKEIKFVYQILRSMGVNVKLPIIVRVDNIGAIFMSENIAISDKSKHVDIRYRFVNEFVQDKFLRIIFVRTADNDADIFTKNLPGELFKKHARKMITEKGLSTYDRKGIGGIIRDNRN